MRLLLWNVEWGKKTSCLPYFNALMSTDAFDLVCLTESTTKFLEGWQNVLRSPNDYGYANPGGYQKVCLWSRYGWTDIDYLGSPALPPGRFLSGITNGIRIIGVCIPWDKAHVSSGEKNREWWEDHKRYLVGLKEIIARHVAERLPIVLLGDFNQRVPPTSRNDEVFPFLEDALGAKLSIRTAGIRDVDGGQLIDHVATTSDITFSCSRTFSKNNGDGNELSDHCGIVGSLAIAGR